MGDSFVYNNSLESNENEFLFENKVYTQVPDSNNGSYPIGQINFSLESLGNNGRINAYNEYYVEIPLVANLELTGATTSSVENAFAVSFKNGFHQLINSVDVKIGGNSLTNLTNFSNLDINYRILTTSSKDDEATILPSIGFHKDSSESISYQQVGSTVGIGECNNKISDAVFTSAGGWGSTSYGANKGRIRRCMQTGFNPIGGTQAVWVGANALNSATSGKNHVVFVPPVGANTTSIQYNVIATLRLSDLHDVFRKLPMVRSSFMTITLNTNCQCSSTMTLTAGATFDTCVTNSINGTFPLMISPLTAGQGAVLTGTTKAVLSLGIAKSLNGQFNHPTMTSCRMFAAQYIMSPVAEQRYFSQLPVKKIAYNDILNYSVMNVASGAQVNYTLNNSVTRPRYLLMIPMLSASVNGSTVLNTYTAGQQIGSTANSPFSSSPATTCPYAVVSNFNVFLSSSPLYIQNITYGFEHFLNEVRGSNCINGGVELGMSNGLISQQEWEGGYRFYYTDLSRKASQSDDDKGRSLSVIFTNSSPAVMDYQFIVAYEREVSISTSTGSLVV